MNNHNKEIEARCSHCYRYYIEGTTAWALYMMRMGHEITNPMYDTRVYHLSEGGMIHVNGVETLAASEWIDYWCIDIPDSWEIYEEQIKEPEPIYDIHINPRFWKHASHHISGVSEIDVLLVKEFLTLLLAERKK